MTFLKFMGLCHQKHVFSEFGDCDLIWDCYLEGNTILCDGLSHPTHCYITHIILGLKMLFRKYNFLVETLAPSLTRLDMDVLHGIN